MKKWACYLMAAGYCILLSLFMTSCEENCDCVQPDEEANEYHLFYPGAGTGVTRDTVLIYSTLTGQVVDTIWYEHYLYDMAFTSDGALMVLGGKKLRGGILIWVEDYITHDTLADFEPPEFSQIELNFQETELLVTAPDTLLVLAFPSLEPIYAERLSYLKVGFLPGENRLYYLKYDVDSLFTIDYSNVTTPVHEAIYLNHPFISGGRKPLNAMINHVKGQIILNCVTRYDYSRIQIRDADDFEFISETFGYCLYEGFSEIRPGTDEIYFISREFGTNPDVTLSRVDIFNSSMNIMMPFMDYNDIVLDGNFFPLEIVFTPDGGQVYILLGGTNFTPASVLGFQGNSKKIVQLLKPHQAGAPFIRINPRAINKKNP